MSVVEINGKEFYEKNVRPVVKDALYTRDLAKMKEYANSPFVNVRRALAQNRQITPEIAKILVSDKVVNVAYMANCNPRLKHNDKRVFRPDELTFCVVCDKNEAEKVCGQAPCKNKGKHDFKKQPKGLWYEKVIKWLKS